MKNSVLKSIINNKFLPNYLDIQQYFWDNNLVYNDQCGIRGGFTLDFSGGDRKELFEENLKTQPDNWYYRTHKVKYTLNSLGYRTKQFDDIDWKESIVIFGCSYVFGVGVTDEHTISYFLEKLLGRPVINMGIGGSSIQTALHNSIILNDSEYPIPKAVIYLFTNLNRFQLYQNNYVEHHGSWSSSPYILKFLNSDHIIPLNLMTIKMIRNLWKNKTIYCEYSTFEQEKLINILDTKIYSEFVDMDNLARDLSHAGPVSNMKLAKKIYEKIKPQLDNS
jgi:hypothetical protein